MPRLHSHPTNPAVADWLVENAGGWSIGDSGAQHPGRIDFDDVSLGVVREAVLARLGVTGSELRAACAYESRKAARQANGTTTLALPAGVLEHLGATSGDSLDFTLMPDGRVAIGRATEVDVKAVRARIRAAGVSARLLARLFIVPESTVRRIVKEA